MRLSYEPPLAWNAYSRFVAGRSAASVEAVLTKAKAETPVEVERSAIDSMLTVKTAP